MYVMRLISHYFWMLLRKQLLTQNSRNKVWIVVILAEVEGHEERKGTHRIHLFLDSDNRHTPGQWM